MAWKSPLVGYENSEPLPTTINADGKSLYNPPGPLSAAYETFPDPIVSTRNGFDFHSTCIAPPLRCALTRESAVYYMQNSVVQMQYARELHERVRREFPEVSKTRTVRTHAMIDRVPVVRDLQIVRPPSR